MSHLSAVRGRREDCWSAARLGLLRAAAAWDETRGVKFGSFAAVCIRRAVLAEAFRKVPRPPVLFSELPNGGPTPKPADLSPVDIASRLANAGNTSELMNGASSPSAA